MSAAVVVLGAGAIAAAAMALLVDLHRGHSEHAASVMPETLQARRTRMSLQTRPLALPTTTHSYLVVLPLIYK